PAGNRTIKARRLRPGLRQLTARHAAVAAESDTSYNEDAAWAESRRRIAVVRSNRAQMQASGLRIFWVGTNQDQDESGLLPALRRIATVIEFRNWTGSYGQWYWDGQGRVRVFDPAIVLLNARSLFSQLQESIR